MFVESFFLVFNSGSLVFTDEREGITNPDSAKFDLIFSEVESLHQQGI